MNLSIFSPDTIIYQGEAKCVTVPGSNGSFEVLNNHAPIISVLQSGTIKWLGLEEQTIEIQGGFIKVAKNAVTICVEI